jgi:hypothetical protein
MHAMPSVAVEARNNNETKGRKYENVCCGHACVQKGMTLHHLKQHIKT